MNDGVLAAIKWYFECKQYARAKLLCFKPPADVFELRFFHTLYFVNLLSAIEYVQEFLDKDFKTTLKARFVLPGNPDGKNNLRYISALRNALVHRGEDITKRGSVVDGLIVVHAPEMMLDIENKKEIMRNSFGYYILDIIALCESQVGPTILEFLNKHNLFDSINDDASERSNYLDRVATPDMPHFAKNLAKSAFKYKFHLEASHHLHLSLKEMLSDTQISWPRTNV
ncbi:hypothetical protein [Microvirga sp. Mcv34]|uniref:hypothetical protein n=1 Tax=Microvirga sp. Mcv34 TaxID=2926016 RepID=UPI0021CA6499|nr:hypothetical protein [Microvirga sp. Mcv34]